MRYGIGIDTGGTFTDSVVVDFASRRVISKAKALTTKQDLSIGILNSISLLDASLFPEVKLVSISTTLATNSIVEGKGQRVGLILIVPNESTFRRPADIPAEETVVIRGAHDRNGNEAVPLDIAAGREAVLHLKDKVDAFAISGYFSIYNSSHEQKLKNCAASECDLPVVCGHELTPGVGIVERAVTAAFNARLLPIIRDLLDAVRHMLIEKNIKVPLMVARGDGSLISESAARNRPVETILSGPAASMIGASWLTGMNDAVVVDMGGTTTDIGILDGSRPNVVENGAVIGGWQTRTRSLDMWTVGLGGDSKISIADSGKIQIGPRRVEPLSLAALKNPALRLVVDEFASAEAGRHPTGDLDFFTLVRRPSFRLEKDERRILDALDGAVMHRAEIEQMAGPWVDVNRLAGLGFVSEISFTPTDLLHAMGILDLWDSDVCKSAIAFHAGKTGLNREMLIEALFGEFILKLKLSIASMSLASDGIPFLPDRPNELLERILRLDGKGKTSAIFKLNKPIVAVGAPAGAYLPEVAEQLGARLVIPEHAEVANAAGAVTGRVMASSSVGVRPIRPIGFAVIPSEEDMVFDTLQEATAFAEQRARSLAQTRAQEDGAGNIDITVKVEEVTAPLSGGWGKSLLMELKIVAVAIGEPQF